MGVRFNKRIKIAKGVNLNISKRGMSTSVKVGKTTINSRGRITTNFGNGLSHQVNLGSKKNNIDGISRELELSDNDLINVMNVLEIRLKFFKYYNIFMRICFAILSPISLLLGLIYPFMILVSIISGYLAFKFNLFKKQREQAINDLNQLMDIIQKEYVQE